MTQRLPALNALRAFEAAARHLSFKKAADELCVTPAAVSHQLSQLESQLGVKLFVRLNQGIQLTPAARASLAKLQEGFDCLREGVELIANHTRQARLSIAASPSFATLWLLPRLHRFVLEHPDIDVHVATRMGPFLNERNTRQVRDARDWTEEADVVVMLSNGNYPDLHVEELMPLSVTPLCSPSWLQAREAEGGVDWDCIPLLHDDRGTLYTNRPFWSLWLEGAGIRMRDVNRGVHFTHAVTALGAAEEGKGIVVSTPELAAQQLASGKLLRPFPLDVPLGAGYHLACSQRASCREEVEAFRKWVRLELRQT